MIRSLASGTNASLVAKNGTKKTFQTSQFLIAILPHLEAEFDYSPFLLFVEWCFKIMHKKFQVNLTKIEGVTAIFVISPVMTILVYR